MQLFASFVISHPATPNWENFSILAGRHPIDPTPIVSLVFQALTLSCCRTISTRISSPSDWVFFATCKALSPRRYSKTMLWRVVRLCYQVMFSYFPGVSKMMSVRIYTQSNYIRSFYNAQCTTNNRFSGDCLGGGFFNERNIIPPFFVFINFLNRPILPYPVLLGNL